MSKEQRTPRLVSLYLSVVARGFFTLFFHLLSGNCPPPFFLLRSAVYYAASVEVSAVNKQGAGHRLHPLLRR